MLWRNPNPLPRTVWGETWRILVAGLFGALLLTLVSVDSETTGRHPAQWLVWLDVGLGVLSLALLPLRRRYPFPVAMLLTLFGFVSVTSAGAGGVALVSLATHRRWLPVSIVGVVSLAAGFLYEGVRPANDSGTLGGFLTTLAIGLLSVAVCIAIGYYIGTRRALFASWQERAETAEREQASRVAEARANERARIAREMHDVLAHRISLVAMHSGALAYRTDLSAQETSQAAEVIRDNAHLALTELREVLGVLRLDNASDDVADAPVERPQPTLADLDELLEEARSAGARLTATVDLDGLGGMPESLSRNAFRIVQELVTNARKHAPQEPLDVRVVGRPGDGLTIATRNGVPAAGEGSGLPGSGMGLAGITERAVLSGGTLTFGVDRRGDFVVTARLPWEA